MTTVDDADAWWSAQSAQRRLTIYGWLHRGHQPTSEPIDGQLEMPFPEPDPEAQ